jgi:Recombination endonuclease VII
METCKAKDCGEPVAIISRGLCRKHYARWWRTGSTNEGPRKNARGVCSVEGCGRPHQARGLCYNHWKSKSRKQRRIEVKEQEARSCGFCGAAIPPAKRRRGPVSYCDRSCKAKAWVAGGGNAIAARKWYFKERYGLTPEQVEEMAAAGCGVCGTTNWNGRHARPHVDHDHQTGKVRGILCSECNTGLGKFKDDPDLLRAAIRYVEGSRVPS